MIARSADSWFNWIFIGILVAFGVLMFVIFPALILLAALFERLNLRKLIPYEPDRPPTGKPAGMVHEGVRTGGFTHLGTFTDGDKGIKMGLVTLCLSPDGRTVLWAQHRGGARVKLISRLADGRRVISSTVLGVADLSGFDNEEMLRDASLAQLSYHHVQRLAPVQDQVVPFDPATLLDDVLAHDRRRVERMAEIGMARFRSGSRDCWSYTPRGAIAVTMGHFRNLSQASKS